MQTTLGIPLICVDTPAKWEAMTHELLNAQELSWDTETTGLDVLKDTIVGMSFCDGKTSWYIPMHHKWTSTWQAPRSLVQPFLRQLFSDPTKIWIAHNFGFDYKVIKVNFGIKIKGTYHDTMIQAWLVDENSEHGLKFCSKHYLKYTQITFDEVLLEGTKSLSDCAQELTEFKKKMREKGILAPEATKLFIEQNGITDKSSKRNFSDVPEYLKDLVTKYGCDDAVCAYFLHKLFIPILQKEATFDVYTKVDVPLIEVIAEAELEGFPIDVEQINRVSAVIDEEQPALLAKMFEIAGHEFNPNSPKQLAEILYDEMKLPVPKILNKKTRKYEEKRTTDKEAISELPDSEFCESLARYKQLQTLKSSFTTKLVDMLGADGKLHASFNQIGTVTGRFSCSNPNLQNIPVRTKEGQEIRKAFVAPEGMVLVNCDLSQIELRVIAHFSKDPVMVSAYMNGRDLHIDTAANISGIPYEDFIIAKDKAKEDLTEYDKKLLFLRSAAKAINFGLSYGLKEAKLARTLKIPVPEALAFMESFNNVYAGFINWKQAQFTRVMRQGYIRTIFGTVRHLPNAFSYDGGEKYKAKSASVSTKIQGSAGYIMKAIMNNLYYNKLSQFDMPGRRCLILSQVHDELLIQVATEHAEACKEVVKDTLINTTKLSVPLDADVVITNSWGSGH